MRILIADVIILLNIPVPLSVVFFPAGLYVTLHDIRLNRISIKCKRKLCLSLTSRSLRASMKFTGYHFPLP